MSNTKWEFMLYAYNDVGEDESIGEALNRLGQMGWQVGTSEYILANNGTRYVLQRPIPDEAIAAEEGVEVSPPAK